MPEIKKPRRVGEVVELTRDCDIGRAGERAIVIEIDDDRIYMTLIFYARSRANRKVRTGADYRFLKEV